MRYYIRTTAVVFASALVSILASASHAQSTAGSAQTDTRWYAWLGCWSADSAAGLSRSASPSVTCIVPVASSRAVDALTIVGGTVVSRDRIDAGGKPHTIDGQGCKGTETANWSASGHRVYLHATYTCAGGTPGASTTILAFTPAGEFLRIEEVRSGGGTMVSTDRLRETRAPSVLSADALRGIERQALSVTTARAAAAVPITNDEIIEASRTLDANIVRSWVLESDQPFDGQQVALLSQAGVPQIVLQAIMGANARSQMAAWGDSMRNAPGYSNYPNAPSYSPDDYRAANQMTTMYRCPPEGCYANPYSTYNGYAYPGYGYAQPYYSYGYLPYFYTTPIIVGRGVNHGFVHIQPRPPIRPAGRPPSTRPPSTRPPAQAPPSRPRGPSGRRP
ncbi:MAG: hypothetical protein ABJF01_18490 [bacterium]